ncbi:MAG: hypothetical protein FGM41_08135 [Bacteroidetes bacterium]|nr:hypothetical protein [Bacteroidota bacterium]
MGEIVAFDYPNETPMKRFFKIIGTLVLVLVLILLIGAAFIHFRGIPSYETGKVNLTVPITTESVQQG